MTDHERTEGLIRDAYREAVGYCDSEGLANHTLHMEAMRVLAWQLHTAIVKIAEARDEIERLKAEREGE